MVENQLDTLQNSSVIKIEEKRLQPNMMQAGPHTLSLSLESAIGQQNPDLLLHDQEVINPNRGVSDEVIPRESQDFEFLEQSGKLMNLIGTQNDNSSNLSPQKQQSTPQTPVQINMIKLNEHDKDNIERNKQLSDEQLVISHESSNENLLYRRGSKFQAILQSRESSNSKDEVVIMGGPPNNQDSNCTGTKQDSSYLLDANAKQKNQQLNLTGPISGKKINIGVKNSVVPTKPISKITVKSNRFNLVVAGVAHKTIFDEACLEDRQSTRHADPNSTQNMQKVVSGGVDSHSNNSYQVQQTTQKHHSKHTLSAHQTKVQFNQNDDRSSSIGGVGSRGNSLRREISAKMGGSKGGGNQQTTFHNNIAASQKSSSHFSSIVCDSLKLNLPTGQGSKGANLLIQKTQNAKMDSSRRNQPSRSVIDHQKETSQIERMFQRRRKSNQQHSQGRKMVILKQHVVESIDGNNRVSQQSTNSAMLTKESDMNNKKFQQKRSLKPSNIFSTFSSNEPQSLGKINVNSSEICSSEEPYSFFGGQRPVKTPDQVRKVNSKWSQKVQQKGSHLLTAEVRKLSGLTLQKARNTTNKIMMSQEKGFKSKKAAPLSIPPLSKQIVFNSIENHSLIKAQNGLLLLDNSHEQQQNPNNLGTSQHQYYHPSFSSASMSTNPNPNPNPVAVKSDIGLPLKQQSHRANELIFNGYPESRQKVAKKEDLSARSQTILKMQRSKRGSSALNDYLNQANLYRHSSIPNHAEIAHLGSRDVVVIGSQSTLSYSHTRRVEPPRVVQEQSATIQGSGANQMVFGVLQTQPVSANFNTKNSNNFISKKRLRDSTQIENGLFETEVRTDEKSAHDRRDQGKNFEAKQSNYSVEKKGVVEVDQETGRSLVSQTDYTTNRNRAQLSKNKRESPECTTATNHVRHPTFSLQTQTETAHNQNEQDTATTGRESIPQQQQERNQVHLSETGTTYLQNLDNFSQVVNSNHKQRKVQIQNEQNQNLIINQVQQKNHSSLSPPHSGLVGTKNVNYECHTSGEMSGNRRLVQQNQMTMNHQQRLQVTKTTSQSQKGEKITEINNSDQNQQKLFKFVQSRPDSQAANANTTQYTASFATTTIEDTVTHPEKKPKQLTLQNPGQVVEQNQSSKSNHHPSTAMELNNNKHQMYQNGREVLSHRPGQLKFYHSNRPQDKLQIDYAVSKVVHRVRRIQSTLRKDGKIMPHSSSSLSKRTFIMNQQSGSQIDSQMMTEADQHAMSNYGHVQGAVREEISRSLRAKIPLTYDISNQNKANYASNKTTLQSFIMDDLSREQINPKFSIISKENASIQIKDLINESKYGGGSKDRRMKTSKDQNRQNGEDIEVSVTDQEQNSLKTSENSKKVEQKSRLKMQLMQKMRNNYKAQNVSPLKSHSVMRWLQNLAKNPVKRQYIKDSYYRSDAEIRAEKQIDEMFTKLDTDGSNGISMTEMQELFAQNGIEMSKEQVANIFQVVKLINDARYLSDSRWGAAKNYQPTGKWKHQQTMDDKLQLQLSKEDFHMVTENPQALKALKKELCELKIFLRTQNYGAYIPVTIDELMFNLCANERRKENVEQWKTNQKGLLKSHISQMTHNQLITYLHGAFGAISNMLGETNSEFSRFKNEQNRIYLKLLEKISKEQNRKITLLFGTHLD